MTVEGKTDEEIAKVLKQFELLVNVSGTTIDVSSDTNVKNWVQYNSFFYKKNTITFNDGTRADGITDTEISLVVYLPKVKELSINNKYDGIKFDSFNSDVNVQQFSGDFTGGDIDGTLDIDLKYGKINIGNIVNGKFMLFDSDASFGNGEDIEISSKYSDLTFLDVVNLKQVSFDDELSMGNIQGELDIEAKYSEILFKNFDGAILDLFDCDLEAGAGSKITFDSKYSSIKFNDLAQINVNSSFDDDFNLSSVSILNILNSKYSEFTIDQINKQFLVSTSFDDVYIVKQVGDSISDVSFNSKYTDLDFPMPNQVAFHLDANLQHCDFTYPEITTPISKNKNGDSLMLVGKVNNPSNEGTKVKIVANSGTITIK